MPRKRPTEAYYKRRPKSAVYYAYQWDEAANRTVRESLHTTDDATARVRFARILIDGFRSSRSGGHAGVTVAVALDWYDEEHVQPNVVDKTRQRDALAHLRAFFGDTLLRNVDIFESRGYAEARRKGLIGGGKRRKNGAGSDSTIRRELNALVAAANHAVRFHKMPKTDLPTVELPSETRSVVAPWLTKAQLTQAIAAADGHLRDFLLIAYYTGARRASIERLTKAQVDLKHGRINLQPADRKQTKKRRPIVPVYPEIRPVLERLMNKSTTEYVFGTPQNFYRPFVELMADIGVGAHPHMLRHSRATHMLMDGEDPYKVARLLGDTLQTVERVYGHHSIDYLNTTSGIGEVA